VSRYKGGRAELPTVVGFRPTRTCSISNIVCLSFCSSLEKGQLYIFRVGSDQVSSIIGNPCYAWPCATDHKSEFAAFSFKSCLTLQILILLYHLLKSKYI